MPGDKSISHRASICAALANGRSELRGLNLGDDVRHARLALAALGAAFDEDAVIGGRQRLRVRASRPEPRQLGNGDAPVVGGVRDAAVSD